MYDAAHGFANPSNPRHNPEATADAYKHALTYLKNKFS
jgi:carboxymethylenebutenolidase